LIPFNVNVGGTKVGITWASLFWFFVVTAAATVAGEYVYQQYVIPKLGGTKSP